MDIMMKNKKSKTKKSRLHTEIFLFNLLQKSITKLLSKTTLPLPNHRW